MIVVLCILVAAFIVYTANRSSFGSATRSSKHPPDLFMSKVVACPVIYFIRNSPATMFGSKHIAPELLQSYHAQSGETIDALSVDRPLLLVFLRHFG